MQQKDEESTIFRSAIFSKNHYNCGKSIQRNRQIGSSKQRRRFFANMLVHYSQQYLLFSYPMDFTDQQVGLLAVGIIKLFTYLTFLAFYGIRINKLDKLASNSIQKDRSVKYRIVGISLLIFLDALHIILSYFDPYYYMAPYANSSLIGILAIFDLMLQIYIITREHKKMTARRSRSIVMLWIFFACEEISTIIIVEFYVPNTGIILPILKTIISIVLIIITFLIQHPKQAQIDRLNCNLHEPRLPILSETGSIYERSNDNIYIEFNKQFQVSMNKEYFEFSFKIAVYVCGKFNVITKSETDFMNLAHDLNIIFPNCQAVYLNNILRLKDSLNITKCGEEKQKYFQAYLIELTKNPDFYCEPLMIFLQIKESQIEVLKKSRGMKLLKKGSMNSDEEEKQKRPFFIVNNRDSKIYISNPQILEVYVNRSKAEMISFHHKLLNDKKLRIELLSEDAQGSQLQHFIFRVANSKFLWRNFAQWMCLGSVIEDKVFNLLEFWNSGFESLDINVIGYETTFDKTNSVIYLYLISIKIKNTNRQSHIVRKRFNDFVKLDSCIKKFVLSQNMKVNLPHLPPRYSPFESKISPNSRRLYFDNYLKDLLKIDGMNYCIKLLQFLELNNEIINHSQASKEDIGREDSFHPEKERQREKRSESGPVGQSREIKVGSEIFESIKVDELGLDN